MSNTPTAKHFLDRLLDRKDAAEVISEEMKIIYREAKEVGIDKTALGLALNYLVKRRKGKAEKADEAGALMAQYLADFDAPHARARASIMPVADTSDKMSHPAANPQKPKEPFKPWLTNSKDKRADG